MKYSYKLAFIIILINFLSGCATSYKIDRINDAEDVFDAAVGFGFGYKARIGPINICPIIFHMSGYGLEGGEFSSRFKGIEAGLLCIGGGEANHSDKSEKRNKHYNSIYILGISTPGSWIGQRTEYPLSYFTQIEFCAGLGGTVKFGFNPGELIDLILGLALIDIYSDDLESVENRDY